MSHNTSIASLDTTPSTYSGLLFLRQPLRQRHVYRREGPQTPWQGSAEGLQEAEHKIEAPPPPINTAQTAVTGMQEPPREVVMQIRDGDADVYNTVRL